MTATETALVTTADSHGRRTPPLPGRKRRYTADQVSLPRVILRTAAGFLVLAIFVLPYLIMFFGSVKTKAQIRREVAAFLTASDTQPELWAWVGAYDHVVLAQLWGDMSGLPRTLPRFTRELKQYWEMAGRPKLPSLPKGNHNALVDARHNVAKFNACREVLPLEDSGAISTLREHRSTR